MTLERAKLKACYFSNRYLTFWYVRQVSAYEYEPWAHDPEDGTIVATYYVGKPWTE